MSIQYQRKRIFLRNISFLCQLRIFALFPSILFNNILFDTVILHQTTNYTQTNYFTYILPNYRYTKISLPQSLNKHKQPISLSSSIQNISTHYPIYPNNQNQQYRQMNILKNTKKQYGSSQYLQNKQLNQFNFLMQSLDRQKLDHLLQKQKTNMQNNKYQKINKPILTELNKIGNTPISSPSLKGKDNKQNQGINSSELVETLIIKIKKYLAITESIINQQIKPQEKTKKLAINIACQLIKLVQQFQSHNYSITHWKQQSPYNNINSPVNIPTTDKSLSTSFHSPNSIPSLSNTGQELNTNFIKKIENLQQENLYLENIISCHEKTNIKMFIKLNQGQSEIIEEYKKQLSSLFSKYKQLQKLVKRQSQKSKYLQLKLTQSLQKQTLSQSQNTQLTNNITNLQQVINDQNNSLGIALQQIEILTHKLSHSQNGTSLSPTTTLSTKTSPMQNKYQNVVSEFPAYSHPQRNNSHQMTINSINNKNNEKKNTSINSQPNFTNISLKQSNETNFNQNLLRALIVQANAVQLILKKMKNGKKGQLV